MPDYTLWVTACSTCGARNPERARFCFECGAALPERAPAGEVRKVVTILFSDVAGSTALGERLDPEAVREVMGRYFSAARQAIEFHGGTVEKFIGDAVMAVFGIPQLHEDDAIRAVRAADAMRRNLRSLNEELQRQHGLELLTRTGINTGEVIAGDPGTQTLVTGDAVNTAARLEQAAEPGSIVIGELTYRLVHEAIDATPLDAARGTGAKPCGGTDLCHANSSDDTCRRRLGRSRGSVLGRSTPDRPNRVASRDRGGFGLAASRPMLRPWRSG